MANKMVRNGQKVVPTCPECGCRLEEFYPDSWRHFGGNYLWKIGEHKDARGCLCKLIDRTFSKFEDGWRHINHTQTLHWIKF